MPNYLCLIFCRDDHVLKVETYERANLAEAELEAVAIMRSTPDTRGFELWSAGAKVRSYLTRRRGPWEDPPDAKSIDIIGETSAELSAATAK